MTQDPSAVERTKFDLGGIDPFDLSGRHALVTGATTDLAHAIATALAEAGAIVSAMTLHDDAGEAAQARAIVAACATVGGAGAVRQVDLTHPATVGEAVAAIEQEVAPIDILVNAAHMATIRPILEATVDDWHRELLTNATSVFVACRAVAPGMIARGHGRIVNLVSILHDRGIPNGAIFGASQGAIVGFTKSAGLEWGRGTGVTVNALALGFFAGVPGPQADPVVAGVLERYVPLRRLGTPEDLKGAVVYLCSDHAGFVDSELVLVDGAIAIHA